MQQQERILLLARKIAQRTATPEEALEAAEWAKTSLSQEETVHLAAFYNNNALPDYPEELNEPAFWNETIAAIMAVDKPAEPEASVSSDLPTHRIHFLRRWGWVAAIIILLFGSGIYYFNLQSYKSNKSPQITVQTITPGTDKAIWILADGKQIELDSTILDMTAKNNNTNNIGYNELRTPRGGQYQLILPDGSKVWLNAASSIKYPVVFDGKERKVDVTGEAYFEIEKDANKPFKVYGGGQEIEVLGTSFNVNVYNDEPIKKTTLITGSIKITNNNQTAILKPGHQANIPILSILPIRLILVQTEEIIAWKNGLFQFNYTPLPEVMRQLSRWYDIEIVYENGIPDIQLIGDMKRNLSLQKLLEGLNELGVQYRMEGRRLIVLQ